MQTAARPRVNSLHNPLQVRVVLALLWSILCRSPLPKPENGGHAPVSDAVVELPEAPAPSTTVIEPEATSSTPAKEKKPKKEKKSKAAAPVNVRNGVRIFAVVSPHPCLGYARRTKRSCPTTNS
jgi:hypothetical protein